MVNMKAWEPHSSTLWVVYGAHQFIMRDKLALGLPMAGIQVDHQ